MKHASAMYAAAFLASAEEKRITSESLRRFLALIRRNGDIGKVDAIVKKVEILLREREGMMDIEVCVAKDISSALASKIKKQFGKKANVTFFVRSEILGGIILKINGETVIDASVKTRLSRMF